MLVSFQEFKYFPVAQMEQETKMSTSLSVSISILISLSVQYSRFTRQIYLKENSYHFLTWQNEFKTKGDAVTSTIIPTALYLQISFNLYFKGAKILVELIHLLLFIDLSPSELLQGVKLFKFSFCPFILLTRSTFSMHR